VTPRQAARLRAALRERWPEATDIDVTADADGAKVQMKVDGRAHLFSVADGGTLLRLFLLSKRPGEP
jgi:hypothetical protein